MRYKLHLAYDGTDFAGWQLQPGQRTVQLELERALAQLFQHPIRVHPGGRTDAGVHALDQVVVFDSDVHRTEHQVFKALNGLTPSDIAVMSATVTAPDFDPRRWSREKLYRYRWQVSAVPDPLRRRTVRWLRGPFDVSAGHDAAQVLVGTHDFATFRAVGCASKHAVRHVYSLELTEQGDEVHLMVRGNGFLRHMVRIIAGCVEAVALGRQPASWVQDALEARERSAAGQTLPARGLCLMKTSYTDEPPPWAAISPG